LGIVVRLSHLDIVGGLARTKSCQNTYLTLTWYRHYEIQ